MKGLGVVSAEDHQNDSLTCIGGAVWNAYTVPTHLEPRSTSGISPEMNTKLHDCSLSQL